MKKPFLYLLLTSLVYVFSCTSKPKNNTSVEKSSKSISVIISKAKIDYATGFSIEYYSNFKILRIFNPWQGAKQISASYMLYPKGNVIPEFDEPCLKIATPIESIVCLSTTHLGFIEALDELESVKGISGARLINNKIINDKLEQGNVLDVGYDQSLNQEILSMLNPDIILAYSVTNELSSIGAKLQELGLTMILNAEYLELHPLGKTEWIKFVAAFYNKEEMANEFFDNVAEQYLHAKAIVSNITVQPLVMTGLPWKDTWYVPTSDSYTANLINDAGGKYLWNKLQGNKPAALGVEKVYHEAQECKFWINAGIANSIDDITASDERLSNLKVVKQLQVYNNNNRRNANGGNDYWEKGLVQPHIILKDLIEIFHPEKQEHELVYYKHLN